MKKEVRYGEKTVYGKMAGIFAGVSILALLVFAVDNKILLFDGEHGIQEISRNKPGAGEKQEELAVTNGKQKDSIVISIPERQYSETEIETEFQEGKAILEKEVLGENASWGEVRKDLNLLSSIPEKGIRVEWQLDNYEVMNLQGQLQPDALTENGTLLRLDAFLCYGEKTVQYTFYAHLYPPKLTTEEKWKKRLQEEIQKINEKSPGAECMSLPKELDGEPLKWEPVINYRAGALPVLGLALAMLVYVSEGQKKKEAEKRRKQQLQSDYAHVIGSFTLYLGAGMTARSAWIKMARDYEECEKQKEKRPAYEEMVYTMHELQSGASESECYEHFGDRCGLATYRKFGVLLSQNLKKGTRGLADLLKQESVNAFEERKSVAKMRGEEAGTKMLLPMFLMLGVVLIMIVFPAFFTTQIS